MMKEFLVLLFFLLLVLGIFFFIFSVKKLAIKYFFFFLFASSLIFLLELSKRKFLLNKIQEFYLTLAFSCILCAFGIFLFKKTKRKNGWDFLFNIIKKDNFQISQVIEEYAKEHHQIEQIKKISKEDLLDSTLQLLELSKEPLVVYKIHPHSPFTREVLQNLSQLDVDILLPVWNKENLIEIVGIKLKTPLPEEIIKEIKDLIKRSVLLREKKENTMNFLEILSPFIFWYESKKETRKGHSEAVGRISLRLSKALGLSEEFCKKAEYLGYLHDIGLIKLNLKDDASNSHAKESKRLLENFVDKEFQDALENHHSNGGNRLTKILQIAESYRLLMERGLSKEEAVKILENSNYDKVLIKIIQDDKEL